jgi:hypothetical protein
MIFTNNKRVVKTQQTPLQYVASPVMTFSHKFRTMIENAPPPPLAVESVSSLPKKKSMKWGEPTWFLFHTLAEKIKPESFSEIYLELINVINMICSNLPCPDCAKHAAKYMSTVNVYSIQNKDHLRIMLHRFHNEVNNKKGVDQFPFENLTPKYSTANTVNIIQYFMVHFEDKGRSIRLIADDLHRARICSQLRAWFSKNIGFFEL